MLFKIGDKIYDPKKEPIAIAFKDDDEKENLINNIRAMLPGFRIITYNPDDATLEQMKEFVKDLREANK